MINKYLLVQLMESQIMGMGSLQYTCELLQKHSHGAQICECKSLTQTSSKCPKRLLPQVIKIKCHLEDKGLGKKIKAKILKWG